MAVEIENAQNGGVVTIKVSDKFDFSLHRTFREAYKNCSTQGVKFEVDLSKADYMDSSALGMLLLLREHVEGLNGNVSIVHPSESVKKVLTVASFDRLFSIVD